MIQPFFMSGKGGSIRLAHTGKTEESGIDVKFFILSQILIQKSFPPLETILVKIPGSSIF